MPARISFRSWPAGTVPAGRARQSERSPALKVQRRLQAALGAMWLIDGALQLQPFMFSHGFVTQVLEPSAQGQPSMVADVITRAAHLFGQQPVLFNAFAAALQIEIGIALLFRCSVRLGLALSVAWGLGIWCFGEGFGGLLTGTASPLTGAPGAAVLYVVISLILWPANRSPGRTAASTGRLGETGTRVAWAVIWLLLAGLWLTSANRTPRGTQEALAQAPAGTGWLASLERWAAHAAGGHGLTIAIVLALLSGLLGLGVLVGRWTRPLIWLSALIAIGYWILGQGLGGIFTGQATDPNTGPLLILLGASLYPAPAGATTDNPSPHDGKSYRRVWPRQLREPVIYGSRIAPSALTLRPPGADG